jgi:hypothetical protein
MILLYYISYFCFYLSAIGTWNRNAKNTQGIMGYRKSKITNTCICNSNDYCVVYRQSSYEGLRSPFVKFPSRGVCTRQPISYQSQLILRIRRSDQHPYYRLNWRNVSFALFHHVIVIERVFLMRAIKFSIAHVYKYNERRLLFIPNQCKNPMMHRIVFSAVDVFLLCMHMSTGVFELIYLFKILTNFLSEKDCRFFLLSEI